MHKTKVYKSTISPVNIIMVAISYQIILIFGYSVLLVVLKLGDGVLGVYGVYEKFV